ncbi:MAG TPA: DUF2269 family protein [Candidatus Limnocylindrales bacterium]|nr:DUF2269 family protein [Candidatus Limnocylindrales bacterium]
MDVVRPVLALIHVGGALLYVTGFLSTKTLTQLAIAESDPARRRIIFGIGDRFDFRFQIVGANVVGLSGIPLAIANGYSLTQPWVLASIMLFVVVSFIGAVIWRGRSASVREALEAGDDPRLMALLTEPRARLLSAIEMSLVAVIVALMVLRPA